MTIIGGGPAGLFASFYAGLREMKVKIIESQSKLGGKVHVYPEKMIWDIGGVTPISGMQLIDQMVEQGLTFSPAVALNETVQSFEKDEEEIFNIHTSAAVHYSKTVLLAIGGGIVDPIKLDIETAHEYEQGNLHYSVKRLRDFQNMNVLISGGGNSAVDWANELALIAQQVTLIYRGESLNGHEKEISRLKENNVSYYTSMQIEELAGNNGQIHAVKLLNNQTMSTEWLEVDAIIINHGYQRDQKLIRESGLEIALKDGYFVKGNAAAESSIPGLYAAGDLLSYQGKLKLIAGAFQDSVNAVNSAKQFLDPGAFASARVSSHNDAFKEKNKQYLYN
ncbi:thioredoxin reductase [Lederbergia galactosidilytica]|uniref:Ferredoxin--NADP reductase n=1 Tax=Lederbergia galactosidilytica TaxID=217031 RepID=A0A0Q9XQU4_9BACI|nr:thioredoxin reductase [Lederbergia galactosidilytica]